METISKALGGERKQLKRNYPVSCLALPKKNKDLCLTTTQFCFLSFFLVDLLLKISMHVFLTANAKSVHYLIAADGNPWVWVLGEDKDDKPDLFEMFKSKYEFYS